MRSLDSAVFTTVRNPKIISTVSVMFKADPGNIFFRCVEDSNDAIMISDRAGILVYVNPAWCRVYGYTKDEAIGNSPKLLHSGLQNAEFYRDMWAKIQDPARGHWKGELVNKAKDSTLVPVLLTITPFKGEDGSILGYMAIAVDMTYKKELEAKVAHQDRLASIGLLASGLAHEVGTPLGVVRGRAELLMMKAPDETFKRDLGVITSQIDRISKLIRSLLRVSRNFSDVSIEPVKLAAAVDDVMGLVGQNLRQDSVEIRIDIPEELRAQADSGRLQQVLLNLIMNSIHAIRKAIDSGRKAGHSVSLSAVPNSGFIELTLSDTGTGISPENMKKLFKPFFTTKDVGEGTGLGLAIVAQLVQEMNGEISCQSVAGSGTTFTIRLKHLPN